MSFGVYSRLAVSGTGLLIRRSLVRAQVEEPKNPKQIKPLREIAGAFFHVRPAWAHSYGCKSRRKLITTSEVKRNCMRVTECGKEAWNINCEPMNKNRIRGTAEQGDWA